MQKQSFNISEKGIIKLLKYGVRFLLKPPVLCKKIILQQIVVIQLLLCWTFILIENATLIFRY